MVDCRFSSGSIVPNTLQGNGRLAKSLDGTIERRAREPAGTSDQRETTSPEIFRIASSNEVLLSLVQMRKQHGVFLLKFFSRTHVVIISEYRHV